MVSRSADVTANVFCFSRTGAPKDVKFNVLIASPAAYLAYAWTAQPTSSSYTPHTLYSTNPDGGAITANRLEQGRYTVT